MTPTPAPFRRLPWYWFLAVDLPVAILLLLVVSPQGQRRAQRYIAWLTPRFLRSLLALTAVAHAGEAALAYRMAGKKGLSRKLWATQAGICGFPAIMALSREKIMAETEKI